MKSFAIFCISLGMICGIMSKPLDSQDNPDTNTNVRQGEVDYNEDGSLVDLSGNKQDVDEVVSKTKENLEADGNLAVDVGKPNIEDLPLVPLDDTTTIDTKSSGSYFKKMSDNSIDTVTLHYAMLEYIFKNQLLGTSVNNYVWEDFLTHYEESTMFTTDELKIMFWKTILPNIHQYELISKEMKIFYNKEKIFLDVDDDHFGETLLINEPKGEGKDFLVYKNKIDLNGSNDVASTCTIEEKSHKLQNAFTNPRQYKNRFGADTDSEADENCLNIVANQYVPTQNNNTDEEKLRAAFAAVLISKDQYEQGLKTLSHEEIKKALTDRNILSSMDHFNNLPTGLRLYLSQTSYFKNRVETGHAQSHQQQDSSSQSSLGVGILSLDEPLISPSLSPQSSIDNQAGSSQRLLSKDFSDLSSTQQSSENISNQASDSASSSSIRTRSRSKMAISKPAVNVRMESWVKSFSASRKPSSKRRRDSSSPV
ncbi:CLUMA_CG007017, isoform A [Clunio marinus]|uniref:CLUMA_CG007017, isoform A n=1 Tax=Clunio marinus TaxID=568069 RepID=A0A1J1I528_9DIPT|nr:CLUMA_CG007017, isoform A [Clunio marinus]